MSGSPDAPLDGHYGLLEQIVPGNNWNPDVAYQIVSGITDGEQYTFSGSYLSDSGFTGSFYPNVLFEISFLNSSLEFLGTVENPENPYFGGNQGNGIFSYEIPFINNWYQGSISGTAPAGAKYAIVFAMFMDDNQTTTENVFFDDMNLAPIPEPSTRALIMLGFFGLYESQRRRPQRTKTFR
jgi:hypothetical protein